MLRPTRALVGLVVAAALTACGDDGDDDAQPVETGHDELPAAGGATGEPVDCSGVEGASVTVEIPDFEFSPTPVEVSACDEVVWSNTHTQPHTSTSNGDVSWSTGNIAVDGQGDPVLFDTPGSYAYMCALHPFMKGTVEVS